MVVMFSPPWELVAAPCGLDGEALAGARAGAAPRALARGRSAAEDGEGPFILLRDAKRTPSLFLGGRGGK